MEERRKCLFHDNPGINPYFRDGQGFCQADSGNWEEFGCCLVNAAGDLARNPVWEIDDRYSQLFDRTGGRRQLNAINTAYGLVVGIDIEE